MSNQRFITLTFLAGAVIIGVTAHSVSVHVLALVGLADPMILNLLNLSTVLSVLSGIATFFILLRQSRAVAFTDEVIVEMRKVFWPSREETMNSTTVVLVACGTLVASLALFDFIWAKITGAFLFS